MNDIFLEGGDFFLRAIRRSDYEVAMPRWLGDREVTHYLVRGTLPQTAEALGRAYEAMAASATDIELTICLRDGEEAVGVCGLHSLQTVPRHAEFRILIGERRLWGRGMGTEVCRLLVAYAFETLNLNKVWLGVNTANVAAARSYEKTGFRAEGTLRQEVYRNGRYYDVLRMSILREEYAAELPGWPQADAIRRQVRGA